MKERSLESFETIQATARARKIINKGDGVINGWQTRKENSRHAGKS